MLKLGKYPAGWRFYFAGACMKIEGAPLSYEKREDAVKHAAEMGILVDSAGFCTVDRLRYP